MCLVDTGAGVLVLYKNCRSVCFRNNDFSPWDTVTGGLDQQGNLVFALDGSFLPPI